VIAGWDIVITTYKTALASGVQYRMGILFQFLAKMAEPLIYLVVWSTVARQTGGSLGGYSVNEFVIYYIAWTLVRQMTTAWDPYWMERRIRRGDFNPLLLRPIHPFYTDTVWMVAMKTVEVVMLVPTLLVLGVLFHPELHFSLWAVLAFVPVLIMAFLARFTLQYALAMTAFWTTRVAAIFDIYFAIEFILSGRFVPLPVLPLWAQTLSYWLPFRWFFYFPLETLLGRLPPDQVGMGCLFQLLWLTASAVLLGLIWRAGIKRYAAVGG
jgi:ABC-2 type transport system permease protein